MASLAEKKIIQIFFCRIAAPGTENSAAFAGYDPLLIPPEQTIQHQMSVFAFRAGISTLEFLRCSCRFHQSHHSSLVKQKLPIFEHTPKRRMCKDEESAPWCHLDDPIKNEPLHELQPHRLTLAIPWLRRKPARHIQAPGISPGPFTPTYRNYYSWVSDFSPPVGGFPKNCLYISIRLICSQGQCSILRFIERG